MSRDGLKVFALKVTEHFEKLGQADRVVFGQFATVERRYVPVGQTSSESTSANRQTNT